MRRIIVTSTVALMLSAAVAQAHVGVLPRESAPGAEQQYTVRVPTEGTVSTTSVELEIPAGVIVSSVAAGEGYTVDVRRENNRIVAISWKQEIKPKERAEFLFVAKNPASGRLVWKAHQHFADGTAAHWVGEPGTKQPAPVTELKNPQSAPKPPADGAHPH